MSLLFFIGFLNFFFLWFIYIRLFIFCTILIHLEKKEDKIRQQLEFNLKSN